MARCNTVQTAALVAKDCATWPALEQSRWLATFSTIDDIRGPLWVRQTQYERARVYTRYLACVRLHELKETISPEGIRAFICDLEARGVRPRSIAGQLWKLNALARFFYQQRTREFLWLKEACVAIHDVAERTAKFKNNWIVSAEALSALGVMLIAEARTKGPADWPTIQKYRDGLFLCFGIAVPERRRALASETISGLGIDARYTEFSPMVMKTKRVSERTFPDDVAHYLEEWIQTFRAAYAPDHDFLWIAKGGGPASPETLAAAMRKVTRERLGIPVTPQRLRDAVATTIVREEPAAAPLATLMLGHTSSRMTRNYVETAGQIAASRESAKIIAELGERVHRDVRSTTRSEIALNPRRRRRRKATRPHNRTRAKRTS